MEVVAVEDVAVEEATAAGHVDAAAAVGRAAAVAVAQPWKLGQCGVFGLPLAEMPHTSASPTSCV